MFKMIFGLLVGGLAAWLYQSERTREQIRQQLADAPTTFRGGVASVASATTTSAQRFADVVDATPLPPQAKERARTATAAVQLAADKMKQQLGGQSGGQSPVVAQSSAVTVVESLIPDEVRAEQDAASRAAAEAERERLSGA